MAALGTDFVHVSPSSVFWISGNLPETDSDAASVKQGIFGTLCERVMVKDTKIRQSNLVQTHAEKVNRLTDIQRGGSGVM